MWELGGYCMPKGKLRLEGCRMQADARPNIYSSLCEVGPSN